MTVTVTVTEHNSRVGVQKTFVMHIDRLSNNAKVFFRMQKGHNVRSSLHDILGGDLFASPRILERCPMESLIKVVEV